jgi:hypothetical protein
VYEDVQGRTEKTVDQCFLLPHEILASFYQFGILEKLTGPPGATWNEIGLLVHYWVDTF